MAETKSLFDVSTDQAEEARLDSVARAEIAAGKGVPHARVREWLLKLKTGESVPPPSL